MGRDARSTSIAFGRQIGFVPGGGASARGRASLPQSWRARIAITVLGHCRRMPQNCRKKAATARLTPPPPPGKTGYERPEALEADADAEGPHRGDPPGGRPADEPGRCGEEEPFPRCAWSRAGPARRRVCTRNFIPHRVHKAIGVFGAVSVATACVIPGSVAAEVAGPWPIRRRSKPGGRAPHRLLHRLHGHDESRTRWCPCAARPCCAPPAS